MSDDAALRQAEKLIGGWVAGTLTDSERKTLMSASLENQTLFDALADEEGLRELLADPAVKSELAALLSAKQAPAAEKKESWWRTLFKPAPMAAFSAGVLALVALFVVRPQFEKQQAQSAPAVGDEIAASKPAQLPPPPPAENEARANRPAASPAPRKTVLSADRRELDALRRDKVTPTAGAALSDANKEEPALPVAPLPPAPKVAGGKVVETVAEAEEKAKKADSSLAKDAAAPPIRYRIERFQDQPGPGMWVELGGELPPGAVARIAVVAARDGMVMVRPAGGDATAMAVRAGQTVYFPPSGGLPSGAGEREVAIMFQPGLASAGSIGSAYRAQEQQQQIPGGGVRQRQQQAQQPGEYSITVRLRYR